MARRRHVDVEEVALVGLDVALLRCFEGRERGGRKVEEGRVLGWWSRRKL